MKDETIKLALLLIIGILIVVVIYSIIYAISPSGWKPGVTIFKVLGESFSRLAK